MSCQKRKYDLCLLKAHHAIFLVVVAEHWETPAVTESGHFPQRIIADILGYRHQAGV